ncbi:MAG: hypothetical protein V3U19_01345, partial [Thermodesulfobacteriota bacterium]
ILPLQFKEGDSAQSLGLTGYEKFDIEGIEDGLAPGKDILVTVRPPGAEGFTFNAICRLDSPVEVDYFKNQGILQTVLRQMMRDKS